MKDMQTLAAVVAAGPEWHDRPDRERITPDRWGKDHGTLFAEVAHCVRERSGRMDWQKVMLSKRHWPSLFAAKGWRAPTNKQDAADQYGLRLGRVADGATLMGHCQGDALMDLRDHGLIAITMPPVSADGAHYLKPNGYPLPADRHPTPADLPTGLAELELMPWATVAFTGLGWKVAHALDLKVASGQRVTWNEFFTEALGEPGKSALL